MVSLRGLVAVPTILVCGLLADTLAQSNPEKARKSEAQAVLDKVRDTFRRLSAYHFERVLIVEEARGDGKLANIAQLTLTTATEHAKPAPDGNLFPPVNLERFRVGTKTLAVLLTDRFTTAALGAPPAELFRFTPPEGAKEVPNVASRRDKRK